MTSIFRGRLQVRELACRTQRRGAAPLSFVPQARWSLIQCGRSGARLFCCSEEREVGVFVAERPIRPWTPRVGAPLDIERAAGRGGRWARPLDHGVSWATTHKTCRSPTTRNVPILRPVLSPMGRAAPPAAGPPQGVFLHSYPSGCQSRALGPEHNPGTLPSPPIAGGPVNRAVVPSAAGEEQFPLCSTRPPLR